MVENVADEGRVLTSHADGILRITLDRPQRRNALSHSMIDELVTVLTGAATDDSLRAVALGGAGSDFCSGADWVATNAEAQRPRTGHLLRKIPLTANRVVELVATIALPVVCAVRGWAVGLGCNLALAADFTVAESDATFWEPFVSRGFTPDSGATWLLPRLAGLARAKRMLLLGEQITGEQAAEWGLIHEVAPAEDLDTTVETLLARVASGPTVAIGLAKQAIAYGQQATLGQSMQRELSDLELSCRTSDFKEGLAAFSQRRTPEYRGR